MKGLAVSKNMTIKGNSRRFETLAQLLGMLENMSMYKLPDNYVEVQQNYVMVTNLEQVHQVINRYLQESEMIYLVVGDAESQLSRMESLGYGKPIVLGIHGALLE